MGYTHYWSSDRDMTADEWKAITVAARKILAHEQDNNGIALSEDYDNNRTPVVDGTEIRFNGYGDEGHETFVLTRLATDFEFCKTACKPYDAAVVAVLIAARQYCSAFSWRSDGNGEDHDNGVTTYNVALGADLTGSNVSGQ